MGFKDICLDFQRRINEKFLNETWVFLKRCLLGFILVAMAVAGPFVAKSVIIWVRRYTHLPRA